MFKRKQLKPQRVGEFLIVMEGLMWSFFPIVSILSFSAISALFSAAISMAFSTLFFGIILTLRRGWREIKLREAWIPILMATFFIGILFYVLTYIGLTKTSAGNASIIALMEIFFSFLIFGLWYKEKLPRMHVLGAALMLIGATVILFPGKIAVNSGDFLILLATFFAPFGNYYAKKARGLVSSVFMLFFRSLISSIFLFFLAYLFEPTPSAADLRNSLIFLFVNGFFLLGLSKILWVEGIHLISVAKAISLNSMQPAFTLFFAYLILNEIPTKWQILGLIPIASGLLLVTDAISFSKKSLKSEF